MSLDSTNLNKQISQDRIFTIFMMGKQKHEFSITWDAPDLLWEKWSYSHSPHESLGGLHNVFCNFIEFGNQLSNEDPTNILVTPAHRRQRFTD